MRCSEFTARAEELLEEQLRGEDRDAAFAHLRACASCQGLLAALRMDVGDLAIGPPRGLTDAILDRTSGPVCESARDRLCGHVDGVLESVDSELVDQHVEGCTDCAALVRVLARMGVELPGLAELSPPPGFVEAVVRATAAAPPTDSGWAARAARAWKALVERPRIAIEGAYAGTLAALLVVGVSPMARAPRAAAELVREPAARLEMRLRADTRSFWEDAVARVTALSNEAAARAGTFSAAALDEAERHLGTLRGLLASEDKSDEADGQAEDTGRKPAEGDER